MATIVSREFRMQMEGYGLTTAEIHYRMPDHPSLLQLYVWQEYDLAPEFPDTMLWMSASVVTPARRTFWTSARA